MPKGLPRYRTGHKELDDQIIELLAAAGETDDRDLLFELVVSGIRMGREGVDRGDLKIANAALKEMRYAFHVFGPYRDVRKLTMFGSARTTPDEPAYQCARDLAAQMAARGWMIMTGAGPGVMTAGLEGAGADMSFGINIVLPFESMPAEVIADDAKLINFRYFFTRKLTFIKESSGFVLLPGGFGTMDEAFELLTLMQTGRSYPAPVVLLDAPGSTYWQTWREFVEKELLANHLISPHDLDLVTITDSIDDALRTITGFYSVFHSMRVVGGRLVLRLERQIDDRELARLNREFSDIVVVGEIERTVASRVEIEDDDAADRPRLVFRFDNASYSRLHQLIRAINDADVGQ